MEWRRWKLFPLYIELIHPSPHKITSERCQTIPSTLNFFTLYKYKEKIQ